MNIRVREYRKKNGLTQKRFAALVGCSQSNIAMIEKHQQDIGVRKLAAWADILGCEFHELVGIGSSVDAENLSPIAGN